MVLVGRPLAAGAAAPAALASLAEAVATAVPRDSVRARAGRLVVTPAAGSDPVRPILAAGLGDRAVATRWGIGIGRDASAAARQADAALGAAAAIRAPLAIRAAPRPTADGTRAAAPGGVVDERGTSGTPVTPRRALDDLALILSTLLAGVTPRQGEVIRWIVLDGHRQAGVAASLGVSRATVSVAVARGNLRAIEAAHRLLRDAIEAAAGLLAPGVGAASVAPRPARRRRGGRP